jgi:CrcB protein
MTAYLAVAGGGALGAVLRFMVSRALTSPQTTFPVATLLINIVGSFALGLLLRGFPMADPALRLALTVGVCGGFTTFSTFSAELMVMIEQQAWGRAVAYGLASIAGGLVATIIGAAVGGRLASSTS